MTDNLSLDDLYKMTVYIYGEQNAHRPTSATFSHFVEVCGMLTVHARKKKKKRLPLWILCARRWVGISR